MSGEILAILPAYNEEVSIGSIVLQIQQNADCIIANGSNNSHLNIKNNIATIVAMPAWRNEF